MEVMEVMEAMEVMEVMEVMEEDQRQPTFAAEATHSATRAP